MSGRPKATSSPFARGETGLSPPRRVIAASVHELHEDVASLPVDRLRHRAPSRDLFGVVEAGDTGIAHPISAADLP
jgi:hypothetical protein